MSTIIIQRYNIANRLRKIVNTIRNKIDNLKYDYKAYKLRIMEKYSMAKFNILQELSKQDILDYQKIHGLEDKPKPLTKPLNRKLKPALDNLYDIQAKNESKAIRKAYRSHTIDFGKRLKKRSGHKHRTPHAIPCKCKILK